LLSICDVNKNSGAIVVVYVAAVRLLFVASEVTFFLQLRRNIQLLKEIKCASPKSAQQLQLPIKMGGVVAAAVMTLGQK
jgi:hypothetical protein